jgi:hypothetical protein
MFINQELKQNILTIMGIVIDNSYYFEFNVKYGIIKKNYKLIINRYIWSQQKII